ncbi:Uncharacterised protein [Escherichia coli]|uniref:Uncharacterized protein n=1 Tax=Escherichia coli TaxID=562 RepID=A0A377K6G8_ECOLX|nr:Uncharacterised protein [Escherichia coli]
MIQVSERLFLRYLPVLVWHGFYPWEAGCATITGSIPGVPPQPDAG